MRGMKSWMMTALLVSGSTQAATILRPDLIKPIKPVLLNPALLAPYLSCSNSNIEAVEIEALSDVTYKIFIKFKNVVLAESGKGQDYLECSLYSKLPTEIGAAAQVMGIVSSRFEVKTTTPKPVRGEANFGVGVVDAAGLNFDGDHYLVPGVAAGLEGQTHPNTRPMLKPMMKKMTAATSIIRDPKIFFPNLGNIADILAKLPTPLILKTTRTGFGDANSTFAGSQTRTIDVDFGRTQATVEDGQYIVNQFSFTILGAPGEKNARAELNWLELVLESQSM